MAIIDMILVSAFIILIGCLIDLFIIPLIIGEEGRLEDYRFLYTVIVNIIIVLAVWILFFDGKELWEQYSVNDENKPCYYSAQGTNNIITGCE